MDGGKSFAKQGGTRLCSHKDVKRTTERKGLTLCFTKEWWVLSDGAAADLHRLSRDCQT